MSELSFSADLLRRFLIGDVADEDRHRIEAACLDRTSETFAAIVALEDELIVEYAAGRLAADERRRLEQRAIAHPGGRERLQFARALAERARRAEAAGEFSSVTTPRAWWLRPAVPAMLAAAVVILAIASAMLFQQTRALRQQAAASQTAASQLAPSIAAAENRVKSLEDQLAQEQSRRQSLEAMVAAPANPRANRGSNAMAAIDLAPGVTRGPGAPLPQVDLRNHTWARVTLMLPQGAASFPRYDVALLNAGGQSIWTVSELRQLDAILTAFVPADRLVRDDYELVVRGRDASGKTEDLASYYFRVTAR